MIYKGLLFHLFQFLPLFNAFYLLFWRNFGEHFGEHLKLLSININISCKLSRDNKKVWYYLEWGKTAGQRRATGIFIWAMPKNQIEKNHNKEALAILETKRSQLILDKQAINSSYIPQHKIKSNFLDYYLEFVRLNPTPGNRHLASSLNIFIRFLFKDFISASEINENHCERFRNYLLKNYNGETPSGCFMRFKRVLKAPFLIKARRDFCCSI